MPELALDDVHRHPLAREFDSVRMSQLMWRKTAANTCLRGEFSQLSAHRGRRPRPPAGRAVDDAEQRTDGELDALLAPAAEVLKPPVVHPVLATPVARAMPDQQRPARWVDVGLAERERLADTQAPAPQDRITARTRSPWRSSPAWRITAMISSTRGGSAG